MRMPSNRTTSAGYTITNSSFLEHTERCLFSVSDCIYTRVKTNLSILHNRVTHQMLYLFNCIKPLLCFYDHMMAKLNSMVNKEALTWNEWQSHKLGSGQLSPEGSVSVFAWSARCQRHLRSREGKPKNAQLQLVTLLTSIITAQCAPTDTWHHSPHVW